MIFISTFSIRFDVQCNLDSISSLISHFHFRHCSHSRYYSFASLHAACELYTYSIQHFVISIFDLPATFLSAHHLWLQYCMFLLPFLYRLWLIASRKTIYLYGNMCIWVCDVFSGFIRHCTFFSRFLVCPCFSLLPLINNIIE